MVLTDRELEVLDSMIEVQINHRDTALRMENKRMGVRQAAWDEERILLLKKLKYHSHNAVLERDKYKKAIIDCIEYANNRESEWGTRAIATFQFLYRALGQED
jgi:hypothetical protein